MNTSKNHLHTNIAIELSLSGEDTIASKKIVDTKDTEIIEEAIELIACKIQNPQIMA